MDILTIGDMHFRKDNLLLMEKLCLEILGILNRLQPSLCVMLGDTLDTHERVHLRPITAACNFIRECSQVCPVILLIGNHDRENNSDFMTDIHPFNGLKGHPNITVVDRTFWDLKTNIIYVPYVPPGRFREALTVTGWTPEGPQPILGFAHQEFKGSSDGRFVSDIGDPWSADKFQIISGHIHQYGVLPGVIYVGTPMQHKFGDLDDNALLLIHINSDETKEYQRIPLTSVPKKIVLHLYRNQLASVVIPENSMIKIWLHLNEDEIDTVQKSPEYLNLLDKVQSIVIKTLQTKTNLAQTAMNNLSIENRISLEEVVSRMLDSNSLTIFQNEILN